MAEAGQRFGSVRARILVSILLVAAFGMGAAGFATYLIQRTHTLGAIQDRLVASVEAARGSVSDAEGIATTRDALREIIGRFVPGRDESTVGLIDGTVAYYPAVDEEYALHDDADLLSRIVAESTDGRVHLASVETADHGEVRYVAAPIGVAGDPEQGIYVVAISLREELEVLNGSFRTYAAAAAITLVAIGLVGWLVAGRLLRPIRQLRTAASRITASDRAERIPVVGSDDVSELTRTVNEMLDRLDSALTSQRQLLDDVRHELKTPITIIRGHLELIDVDNAAEVRAARDVAVDELDRMAGLVDDIEAFAESQGTPPVRVWLDIDKLTTSVVERARGYRNHEWKLAEAASASVLADPARLTQAWLQLVDNAAKYAPAQSVIVIGSAIREQTVELWVQDSGPGIPEGAEDRIFERFGRIDGGRGVRGSGLGLPIVLAIARSHDGTVRLDRVGTGSRFVIVVPTGETL